MLTIELVKDYHKDTISARCALKIDISKAFDTVWWDFILSILQAMAIPDLFISWISSCFSTAAFSVSVNGEVEGFFTSSHGLRQGCSLSPYLFDIANNVPSLLLNKTTSEEKMGYHLMCKKIVLTHLSFADDIMIFMDGTTPSLGGVMEVLDMIGIISGLKIYAEKSSLFIAGKKREKFFQAATTFGFPIDELPIRYLVCIRNWLQDIGIDRSGWRSINLLH